MPKTGDPLLDAAKLVRGLRVALETGGHGLSEIPERVLILITTEGWRSYYVVRPMEGRVLLTHDHFEGFVRHREGLGCELAQLKRLCAERLDVLDAIDQVTVGPQGKHKARINSSSQCNGEAGRGNARAAALRKLRRDAPALHARVLAGDLSPHRAMIEAGFRQPTVTVPVDNVESAVRLLLKHFSPEAIRVALAALDGCPVGSTIKAGTETRPEDPA